MKFVLTIPNLLTIFRVLLIPIILYFIFNDSLLNIFLALSLYGISALTDAFDGLLARKLNQASEFGAYFDPLADKFLIWSVFTVFSLKTSLFIPLWLILFIYFRDLFITFLRSHSRKKNIVFKTSFAAKAKTTVQMISAAIIMTYILITQFLKVIYRIKSQNYSEIWQAIIPNLYWLIIYIPLILTIFAVLFTLYTAVDYLFIYYNKAVKSD